MLRSATERVCRAWLRVGLVPHFVFDGPISEIKSPVVVKRVQQSRIDGANLFFRTSSAARSSSRFLSLNRISVPFAKDTCVFALKSLHSEGVRCFFSDGEGDPDCVAWAAKHNGYVLAQDSDYLILNAQYKGYIPLNEALWIATLDNSGSNTDDDGFRKVRSKKAKSVRRLSGQCLNPPEDFDAFSVTVYHPTKLAQTLKISPGLLPLLSSLLGNDFTPDLTPTFFRRSMSASDRVLKVASVIHDIFQPDKKTRKRKVAWLKDEGDEVSHLINAAISDLALRDLSEKEVHGISDAIRDAIFQYLIPEDLPIIGPFENLIVGPANDHQLRVQKLFTNAYRSGELHNDIVGCYLSATAWPLMFLEDPDIKSATEIIGAPIRRWVYATLADGLDGIGEAEESSQVEAQAESEENEDELIDVVEEISNEESDINQYFEDLSQHTDGGEGSQEYTQDPLVALRDQLQTLRIYEPHSQTSVGLVVANKTDSVVDSLTSSNPRRGTGRRYVKEYVRRNLRLVAHPVWIPSLHKLKTSALTGDSTVPSISTENGQDEDGIPIQLQSLSSRMEVFFMGLTSNTSRMRALPSRWIFLASALRHTMITVSQFLSVSTASAPSQARWTISEGRAFLLACAPTVTREAEELTPPAELSTRSVRLTSQILAALEAANLLARALLLGSIHPAEADTSGRSLDLSSILRFSGYRFHGLLAQPVTGKNPLRTPVSSPLVQEVDHVLEAVIEGLVDHRHVRNDSRENLRAKREERKTKRNNAAASSSVVKGGTRKGGEKQNILGTKKGIFDVLDSLDNC